MVRNPDTISEYHGNTHDVVRLNAKLEAHGLAPMNSLVTDLSDGVKLIQLMVGSLDVLSVQSDADALDRKSWVSTHPAATHALMLNRRRLSRSIQQGSKNARAKGGKRRQGPRVYYKQRRQVDEHWP